MKRGKTLVLIFTSLFLLTAVIAACIVFQRKNAVESVYVTLESDEKIYLYQNGDIYYALLPAYANLDKTQIRSERDDTIYIDGNCMSGKTCSELETNRQYSLVLKDQLGLTAAEKKLVVKQAKNIPAVSIHLTDGELKDIHADQSVRKSGTVSFICADGTTAYAGVFRNFGGRGNSTWTQPKKSYALSFEGGVDLLGMGSAENWVLLANSLDESGLRNKLVYDMAQEMGLPFAVDSRYVDLYVNSRYLGMYLLTERIEVGENRVDITDLEQKTQEVNQAYLPNYQQVEKTENGKIFRGYDIPAEPQDLTGGYLLQVEHHEDRILHKSSLIQTPMITFSLSSPQHASLGQIGYLTRYINDLENQLAKGDYSGIDLDSFSKLYLLQEVFLNTDNCSVFFFKDSDAVDGKLYAGPVWDFDLSMGNGFRYSDAAPTWIRRNQDNWFSYLEQIPRFRQLKWENYTKYISLERINKHLAQYKDEMDASFQMNRARWSNISAENGLDEKSQIRYHSLEEHILRISGFMEERLPHLEGFWSEDSAYVLVSFTSYDHGYYSSRYVIQGETPGFAPDPKSEGYRFVGWVDESGDAFDPQQPVTEQRLFTAKWEKLPQEPHKTGSPVVVSKTTLLVCAFGFVSVLFIVADLLRKRKSGRCKQNGK